jgi:hypothetical protein
MRTPGAIAQDFQMPKSPNLASAVAVVDRIYLVRGIMVILDSDLAALYGVSTKAFNQAVRRNIERFPADFLLKLSLGEFESLRSQFVTLEKSGRGQHTE